MNLENNFLEYIFKQHLFTVNDRLLVAVSGGIDSVVLVHLLHRNGFDFDIAHCNFQLRGDDSEWDERFVHELGESIGKKVFSIKFNTKVFCEQQSVATQEGARMLRYEWFNEIATKFNHDYIVTAHHADDNIETVMMNFFRGTGLNGLKGILCQNGKIVRPLLFASRTDITIYQQKNELQFVHDISNDSTDYTRNYLRNELLPQLQTIYPQVHKNILNNISRLHDSYDLYKTELNRQLKKWLEYENDEIHISVLKIIKTKGYKTILFELIQQYGFTAHQLDDIIKLLDAGTGKYVASATHRILRNRNHIIISKIEAQEKGIIVIQEQGKYNYNNGSITLSISEDNTINVATHIAYIDADKVEYPILLRSWKEGDYFYPLGMDKKKKVSRFLIDQKLSQFEKDKVWVLESNKKIIWIVGYRIDNRFKVIDHTKNILKIECLS